MLQAAVGISWPSMLPATICNSNERARGVPRGGGGAALLRVSLEPITQLIDPMLEYLSGWRLLGGAHAQQRRFGSKQDGTVLARWGGCGGGGGGGVGGVMFQLLRLRLPARGWGLRTGGHQLLSKLQWCL